MPKVARKPEAVQEIKDRILEEALALILEYGLNSFSMRKLARRLGMAAANIYNYYANKDELYLAIQTQGFALLYERFLEVCEMQVQPLQKLRSMMREYLLFGMEHADYYDIMFNRNTPKYADYVGTDREPAALFEKETALQVSELTTRIIMELGGGEAVPEDQARYLTLKIWTTLHGMVTLYNSRVLQEVDDNTEAFTGRMLDDLMKPLIDFFHSKEAPE